jgi:hypothetical protein
MRLQKIRRRRARRRQRASGHNLPGQTPRVFTAAAIHLQ